MIEHKRTGWLDIITWRFSRIFMFLTAIIVLVMMTEVFMRYILKKPTLWANEMSLWIGGWVYLLAGIYAMQQRSHIRITLFYDMAPRWLRRAFDLISTLLIAIWAVATIYGAFDEVWEALITWERFGTAWNPPIPAVTQPLILLTILLITVQAISNLVHDWNDAGEHKLDSEARDEHSGAGSSQPNKAGDDSSGKAGS